MRTHACGSISRMVSVPPGVFARLFVIRVVSVAAMRLLWEFVCLFSVRKIPAQPSLDRATTAAYITFSLCRCLKHLKFASLSEIKVSREHRTSVREPASHRRCILCKQLGFAKLETHVFDEKPFLRF